jgi:hypothetical protein
VQSRTMTSGCQLSASVSTSRVMRTAGLPPTNSCRMTERNASLPCSRRAAASCGPISGAAVQSSPAAMLERPYVFTIMEVSDAAAATRTSHPRASSVLATGTSARTCDSMGCTGMRTRRRTGGGVMSVTLRVPAVTASALTVRRDSSGCPGSPMLAALTCGRGGDTTEAQPLD